MLTENDVVWAVAHYLSQDGYEIVSQLSTLEHGIDIEAVSVKSGRRLMVEAKGRTSSKQTTRRFGKPFSKKQANTHVAVALYFAAKLLQKHSGAAVDVALAFPDDHIQRANVMHIASTLKSLGIEVFFVDHELAVKRTFSLQA
jgi:Holliday junction resolvase-like predicted endonuclease